MSALRGVSSIVSFYDVANFLWQRNFPKESISFKKCLHALTRKWTPLTLIEEKNPDCPEYADECECYKKKNIGCIRFHFFHGPVNPKAFTDNDIKRYLGYCDLR